MNRHLHRAYTPSTLVRFVFLLLLIPFLPAWGQNDYWTPIQTSTTGALMALDFPSATLGVAVGEDGVLLKSTDGGSTWSQRNSGTDEKLWSTRFMDDTTAFACGDGGTIVASTDGGETWSPRTSGLNDGLAIRSFLFGLYALTPQTMLAVGGDAETFSGVVLRSVNGGNSWSKAQVPGSLFVDRCAFADVNIGVAVGATVTGGLIARTTDGGQSWATTHTAGALIVSVQVLSDKQTMIAVGSGGIIYTSTDAGLNWAERTDVTSEDLLDIAFNSNDQGVIVGDGGSTFVSTDRGVTWTPTPTAGQGLLTDIAIRPDNKAIFTCGPGGLIYRHNVEQGAGAPAMLEESRVSLWPNPVRSTSALHIDGIEQERDARVEVYDIMGRAMFKRRLDAGGTILLDGTRLGTGSYIYIVRSARGMLQRGQFIVE